KTYAISGPHTNGEVRRGRSQGEVGSGQPTHSSDVQVTERARCLIADLHGLISEERKRPVIDCRIAEVEACSRKLSDGGTWRAGGGHCLIRDRQAGIEG